MNEKEKLLIFIDYITHEYGGEQVDTDDFHDEYREIAIALNHLSAALHEAMSFAAAIAAGDLDVEAPSRENLLCGPFRALRSSLSHLTWQSQRVAAGDYSQQVDFMGEFSDAFNNMIRQLELREQQLVEVTRQETLRAQEMKDNNELLMYITDRIEDWIIVIDSISHDALFLNSAAQHGIRDYELDLDRTCQTLYSDRRTPHTKSWDISLTGKSRYDFSVSKFQMQWKGTSSYLYILQDITQQNEKIREMELLAYRDPATKLYNRRYCLQLLDSMLQCRVPFTLCFIDLNNLKMINDVYGHTAGDEYILLVANTLTNMLRRDDVICRFGGDEMIAILHYCDAGLARKHMQRIQDALFTTGSEHSRNYSISYGIIENKNTFSSSRALLDEADRRMYAFKQNFKQEHSL
ncbi:sensor domain-containing diguanylate cyclase [Hespellia stercorisuis]|uniref:Diguanylate cyclase (GGDEF) domain-containing protein n=1 Tax=Hespellia stercorisuis DSM 15480 TaxID=1121950 RepID=A0A1M6P564_9FIRM|nr:diguanylate cyclase [Hespellia stercorisuis]SHK03084.1 diguanylate cyclase (GGDEF) domain-containing protein [Hespellia stercorisuis DSM 15480]